MKNPIRKRKLILLQNRLRTATSEAEREKIKTEIRALEGGRVVEIIENGRRRTMVVKNKPSSGNSLRRMQTRD